MVGEGGATHYREATRLPLCYLKELSDKEGNVLNVECFVRPTSLMGLAGAPAEAVKPYEAKVE